MTQPQNRSGALPDVRGRDPRPGGLPLPLLPVRHLPQEPAHPHRDGRPLQEAHRRVHALRHRGAGAAQGLCQHQGVLLPGRGHGADGHVGSAAPGRKLYPTVLV